MSIIEFGGVRPRLAPDGWLAGSATLIGDVRVDERASVWFGAVLRADGDTMTIGADSNVQDGCVLHTDPGFPISVGAGVSVGHRAVLHGCTIGDDVLVGMSATVMNGARIGSGSLIAAGTVLLEGTEIPERALVAGVPGKIRRELTDDELAGIRANAQVYVELAQRYAREAQPVPADGTG